MKTIETKAFQDQLGRTVTLNFPPQRIISLVPSQTELLFAFGLDVEVIGITKFCVHPDKWFKTKTRIGGTKQYDFDKIKALKPDLIIGNKEENDEQQVKQLIGEYPVWMSDIKSLDDALDMIERVGELVKRKREAIEIKTTIENNFSKLKHYETLIFKNQTLNPKALYLIWYNPLMSAAKGTFINDMMQHCGLENACINLQRYPQIDAELLRKLNPEVILLSSEPFPFKQKHIDEMKSICPDAKVILVDGEYFSWYGSRLINAPTYFESVINQIQN